MSTLDAHLVAIDARSGSVVWDSEVADYRGGYSKTAAPLIVKDRVVTGIAGGEFGIRGFLDAYDAESGDLAWRTYTIPGPDHPDNRTWSGDSWRTGGSPTWITGSYDPELDLIYWGTGNPGPDYGGDVRVGDNLYADSVLALRRRHRRYGVVLPVHAARHPRLGRHPDPGARRHRVRGRAAPGDALGEPQRVLLHPRPRDRRVPAR